MHPFSKVDTNDRGVGGGLAKDDNDKGRGRNEKYLIVL